MISGKGPLARTGATQGPSPGQTPVAGNSQKDATLIPNGPVVGHRPTIGDLSMDQYELGRLVRHILLYKTTHKGFGRML